MKAAMVVSTLLAVFVLGPAMAEEITWTGAGDNDWKNPANWDRGRVPGIDDNVTIPSGTPECRVPGNEVITVRQLVNRGTMTSNAKLTILAGWTENYGAISAADKVLILCGSGWNVNYGTITGPSIHLGGDEVGNAAGAVLSTNPSDGYALIYLTGHRSVVNLGQITGGDAPDQGASVLLDSDSGITNEGTIRAGNGLSGGCGGDVVIKTVGSYDNKGTVRAGSGDGNGGGGKVRMRCQQATNSDTVKAGDSPNGKGGSVGIEAGDFTNSVQISPGRGALCVGSLIIVCPTGKIRVTGSMGHSWRRDDSVAGYVHLVGDTVELMLDSADFVNAEWMDVTARNILVSTHGPNARIWAEHDNRFNLLAGDGVLDVSDVDTGGVTAAGHNFLFADSIIPPQIGYDLAFSPAPMISGPDTSMVNATVTELWAADTAGASDTLTVCITNTGTATRVVNYDLASARGWLVPLSGATALLSPLTSESVKTTFTIPDTAVTGSRDITTAVLTIPPYFWDSLWGEIYCYSGLLGIEEPENPNLRTRASSFKPAATVVRVALMMGDRGQMTGDRAAPSDGGRRGQLLDAAGRKVLDLHLGANDVRGLGPGVYFVREGSQGQGFKGTSWKVLIQR